jgi:Flp pilus assembly protein TadD
LRLQGKPVILRPSDGDALPKGVSTAWTASPHGDKRAVKTQLPLRYMAAVVLAATVWSFPVALAAQAPTPAPQQLARTSSSGNYLAGRQANLDRDATAASAYYRAALRADPKNAQLLELSFYAVLADGEVDEAVRLAERLAQLDRNNRTARLVLGLRALKQKQFTVARQQLLQAVRGPVGDLVATLLIGWSFMGSNDVPAAIEAIDRLTGPDWYAIFKDLHAGLILDIAGNKKEAGKRLERAYKADSTALRVVEAYGSWLARNGQKDEALKVYDTFDKALPRHPVITKVKEDLRKGKPVRMIDSMSAGSAEALYGLGAALGRREEELSLANRGLAYLQLALYLYPSHELALLSLADLYEGMKKPQLALNVYSRVPADSVLKRNAEIQMAIDLDSLDRTDEAKKHLEKLIANRPDDLEAVMALGNILRDRKQYAECADAYGKAIALITNPTRPNWTTFYFRGICYERSKQWDKAETDLKKALELFPDQPHVLNYLGYSWVDQGVNLDDGMRMIKRSVEQRPDDGYIVDSLGWAYYRLGNYEEAVKQLERAVELKPVDPTINDHLGDAYWRVGRTLEAKFQWTHAVDLKPEPDDLKKIEEKLKTGLGEDHSSSSAAEVEKSRRAGNGG